MAVVLPINSHIDFTNPMDKEYERPIQNNEKDGTETENKSTASDMLTNAVPENEENTEDNGENNNSMDIGESSDNYFENGSDRLPLNESSQNNSNTKDVEEAEERTPSDSADDYWLMENEESRIETNTMEDENSAFISSLMGVDLAITEMEEPTASKDSDAVDEAPFEDVSDTIEMNVELDEMPTSPGILVDDMDGTREEKEEEQEDNNMNLSSPTSVLVEVTPEAEEETPETPPFGGLENLGNTCYMASAIQFLCGLDSFPADLKSRIPPPENNKTEDGSKSLRDALLDVMDRLGTGETLRPDELKSVIDSRTSLFLGYHQQDSHEFLTTILDIIDEDYKVKTKPEEEEESKENEEDEENEENEELEETKQNTNAKTELTASETDTREQVCDDDENDCDNNDDGSYDMKSLESALKKQKVVEKEPSIGSETIDGEATDSAVIPKSKSYSDFKFSDIENLLHDKDESKTGTASLTHSKSTPGLNEPKCKLAGGRMSTSGVELTPFVEDSGIDENVQPTGVSLENATPQQQIVESTDREIEESVDSEGSVCSPVSSNFTTKVRVCLTCESCKFRRSHIETYLHLSLDISTGSSDNDDDGNNDSIENLGCASSSSIEEGLRRFFAPEKREIKCEKCFHTSALQTSEITQLPRNLLFHLKRFIVDVSPDYSSISYRKDQSSVVFEERMHLEARDLDNTKTYHPLHQLCHDDEEHGFKDFLAADCVYPEGASYEIRSVVNHIGSSASCGHYTADAKRLIDDKRDWIRFNDEYVSTISSKQAVQDAAQTAYMIMYELVHQ